MHSAGIIHRVSGGKKNYFDMVEIVFYFVKIGFKAIKYWSR
jgi:hypothetical protein